jgi:nucleoside-diphosphate-sugar epimerase
VIHLAGLSNDPLGSLAPRFTYEINHEATVRLAEIAKRAGIRRFLYASTCSVYGAAGDDLLDEDSPFNPVTPYAIGPARGLGSVEFEGVLVVELLGRVLALLLEHAVARHQ